MEVNELLEHINKLDKAIATLSQTMEQATEKVERMNAVLNSNQLDMSGFDVINYDNDPDITQILSSKEERLEFIAPR